MKAKWHTPCLLLACAVLALVLSPRLQAAEIVFEEDFESGYNGWWADNGAWQIGEPAAGPNKDGLPSPTHCAGTNLSGNYSSYMSSHLVSPEITLPMVSSQEKLRLRFWQWFELEYNADYGKVKVLPDGGTWTEVHGSITGYSYQWTQVYVDLTAFAGQTLRLGFHAGSGKYNNYLGWYIDDVAIIKGAVPLENPEGFELDPIQLSASNGLWQIGTPTAWPGAAYSGDRCAGTVLDGNYSSYSSSRLITPEFTLKSNGQKPAMYFMHCFELESGADYGYVEISVDGGAWEVIQTPVPCTYTGSSGWNQGYADLSGYAGSTVRVAFRIASGKYNNYKGWFIDDIEFIGIEATPLVCDAEALSVGTGGKAHFILDADTANANRNYILLGSIAGTFPGTPLPGGKAVLPINWDLFFTPIVIEFINTPIFQNFMGALDGQGRAQAVFDTNGPLPSTAESLVLYFAYALNAPWDFASNPVSIKLVQ